MLARQSAVLPPVVARGARGAVTSPHHLAGQAGLGILRAGGSAVDAAIATNAALCVVACYMCGLGGDAFWLIHAAESGTTHALNGSGRSAAGATIAAARAAGHDEMPLHGGWSVTVPGAVDSWREAHERFGNLPWGSLFEASIELAEDGFPASAAWVRAIANATRVFGPEGDWARTFRPHGGSRRLGYASRSQHWPAHFKRSPTAARQPPTRARSPGARPTISPRAARRCAPRTLPRTGATGWSRSGPRTEE